MTPSCASTHHSARRIGAVTALALLAVLAMPAAAVAQDRAVSGHGLSMYGDLKYPEGFAHFDYVSPEAPKGGALRLAALGTFDNLNPYILKGVAAAGLGLTFDTLMTDSSDEALAEYGLLAARAEMPADRSYVVFDLRPEARFHDGAQVTAQDVVFTFNTLLEKGHPFYKAYYGDVKEVKAEGKLRVRFTFKVAGNRELPIIMGQMPVLPKHFFAGKDFSATTLQPVLGSGPYRVKSIDAGRKIVYERVKDWWGKDLGVARGRFNFDTISYDFYRDQAVLLQALLAGEYDLREENIAKAWTDDYKHPAITRGDIIKAEIPHDLPTGMQGFVYNTRRGMFADPLVREALNYAFDFEWSNANFASGTYKRTDSYFENSELASAGLPQGRELEILRDLATRYPADVPARVFSDVYANPKTGGTGRDARANLLRAKALLEQAGWRVNSDKKLAKDGAVFNFEILLSSPAFERWVLPLVGNLKKLGITAKVRTVDAAQYQNRLDGFDFDMTVGTFGQSLSPGNEQRDFWHSSKVGERGSRNTAGIKNPAIDALIDMIINAPDREELIARVHALDRILLWNFYVIPQWHIDYHRVAYWNKFGRPATPAKYGLGIADTWWIDVQKEAALPNHRRATGTRALTE